MIYVRDTFSVHNYGELMLKDSKVLERELEAYFRHVCKKYGVLTIKLNVQNNRGYPDRTCFYNGQAYFAELKTISGTLTPLQKHRISELAKVGFTVTVLRTKQDILEYVGNIKLNLL